MKIYPTITTISKRHFEKLKEAEKLKIKEVALFPTNLNPTEREKFYIELEKSKIENIPFVHLRHDMKDWELEFFRFRFNTKIFNCHPQSINNFIFDLNRFYKIIAIENSPNFPENEELKQFSGLCLDFAHLERSYYLDKNIFLKDLARIKQNPVKCAHISAFRKFQFLFIKLFNDSHKLLSLIEVDYIRRYKDYFPEIAAIELENSIKRQLEVINYLSSKICASNTYNSASGSI